jgi:hypothetical protein
MTDPPTTYHRGEFTVSTDRARLAASLYRRLGFTGELGGQVYLERSNPT